MMAHPALPPSPDEDGPAAVRGRARAGRASREVTPLPLNPIDRERKLLERAVAGRYKIRHLIGAGGMSSVYLAWEFALEREVAIKVLSREFEGNVEDRERFRREARVAASLTHPSIIPVYTFERSDGLTYQVMRYVPGESLAGRLSREERMPLDEACQVLDDMADALAMVHRAGVVHRDIKPDNILLDRATGRAVLTDFGVATVRTSEHSRSEVSKAQGTPQYMSPEHALGEQACDGRSDLYSLGVVAFRMLTGRLPFNGGSARSIVAQHVALEPPPVEHYAPELPEAIARVINRCLSKDPRRRWADATTLQHALRAAQRTGRRGRFFDRIRRALRRAIR